MTHYDPKRTPWSIDEGQFPKGGTLREKMHFIIRYAILAPSSHNSQPWRFRVHDKGVDLLLDHTQWLKIADDDQRELHISVGCALENLLVAAEHFGLGHKATLMPRADDTSVAATVEFDENGERGPHRAEVLFEMIPVRHTNHGQYEERMVPAGVRQKLQEVCVEDGVSLHLTDDDQIKRKVNELVVRGDAIQFADPDFREELAHWIGQGVFGTSWLLSKIGKLAVSYIDMGKSQGKKDSEVLMSSPELGIICTDSDDRPSQLKVGQVYQRVSLLAASHGIWCQPMSQIVEVPELKAEVAELVPETGITPQHPFRMGYAQAEKDHTPRRPVDEVLV